MSPIHAKITPAPTSHNTVLVVVAFNPDPQFLRRLGNSAAQFARVYIVDNSEPPSLQLNTFDRENIELLPNKGNTGLGSALNRGCRQALSAGFTWAVTLDQDSDLSSRYLENTIVAMARCNSATVLLGCNYFGENRAKNRYKQSEEPKVTPATTVITSGCLTHLPSWHELGEFREDYFIDSIDHEFCLRARQAGFSVFVNHQVLMSHVIGEEVIKGPLSSIAPYRHDAWRQYTAARNTIRTMIDYGSSEPWWFVRKSVGILVELASILAIEPDKKFRLNAYMTGLSHGIKNRMDTIPEGLQRKDD